MLSEQELNTLYGEVNRPYSPKELTAHLADREVKSALEATHAHNLELIALVQGWIDFFSGQGPRPGNKIWRLLMPGTNAENPACLRLETITEHFARFDHGGTPRMPIVVIASRSTVTLLELLDELHHTGHIDEALSHIKNFFALISYGGARKMPQPTFAKRIRGEMAQFIANCSANAKELGIALIERIRSGADWPPKPASAADVKTAAELIVAALAKSRPEKPQRKRQADWRKDDPAVLKRRDDTKRVLAEIRKRHKATSVSYVKIIDAMRRDSVWGARMRHMSAESWRAKAISR